MTSETPGSEHVGIEIRAGRPWFAVCCASCLMILIFFGAIIGYLVTQSDVSMGSGKTFFQRILDSE